MITVQIKDILKDRTYPQGGKALYDIAKKAIMDGDIVSVDMSDVESFPTMFMNTSFGDLICEFGTEKTKKAFVFKSITKSQVERIQKYFDDYKKLLENQSA